MRQFKALLFFSLFAAGAVFVSCSLNSPNLPGLGQGSTGLPPTAFPILEPPQPSDPERPPKPAADPFRAPGDPGNASYRDEIYPFDLQLDTIAYMNCPGEISPENPVYFSFKFGSYYKGLRFSGEFLDHIGRRPTVKETRRALGTSTMANSKGQIYLSYKGNPRNVRNFSNSGRGYGYFFSFFDHVEVINNLIHRGKSLVLGGNRLIETSFPASGRSISQITPLLGKTHVFALTYTKGSKDLPIRKRSGVYYGRTYDVFLRGGSNHNDYMEHIEEVNLLNLRRVGRWRCPEDLRFVIHRHEKTTAWNFDQNEEYFEQEDLLQEGVCVAKPRALRAEHKDLVERVILNRVFTVGESKFWDRHGNLEGTGDLCIVPKHSDHDCYNGAGAGGASPLHIEFDPDEECQVFGGERRCPSYFSICVRD